LFAPSHCRPHCPQLLLSLATQLLPHLSLPEPQVKSQRPLLHVAVPPFAGHRVPQPPQLFTSLPLATQVFPHLSLPEPQVKSQRPVLHVAVPPIAGHREPQPPQLFTSLPVFWHCPLHRVVPLGQL
jgi:hypothetical protein